MATIGLDATYLADPQPTGTGEYSRQLIKALATLDTGHHFLLCYRLSRFHRRHEFYCPPTRREGRGPTFSIRYYQEPFTFWLPWQTKLFHSLAQRPPAFRFEKEIVTINDIFPLTGRDYSTPEFQRRFTALLREAVARAVRIISPSQYTADQLVNHLGVPKEKIRITPYGVEVPATLLTPQERRWHREQCVGPGNEMVLVVGVLDNRKNVVNALRALQRLPARYRLVLAGKDGYGHQTVHDFIRQEGLASRVVRLGYVSTERLNLLYQAASVLLFPSLDEGFGIPVLEAMAHGLPVVASKTSSLPEVGGEAALYVDPHDFTDMAAKVLQAVEDAAWREQIVEKGLKRARHLSWRRTAEATLAVYHEVLEL
jgi:glycosyltransferase involved in cell wall biosynthesis